MIAVRAAAIVGFSMSASRSAVARSMGYSEAGGGIVDGAGTGACRSRGGGRSPLSLPSIRRADGSCSMSEAGASPDVRPTSESFPCRLTHPRVLAVLRRALRSARRLASDRGRLASWRIRN